MITIIGLIIGILLFGAGVYYLQQNKNDAESRKIYGVTAAIGAVVAVVCAVMLLENKSFFYAKRERLAGAPSFAYSVLVVTFAHQ